MNYNYFARILFGIGIAFLVNSTMASFQGHTITPSIIFIIGIVFIVFGAGGFGD